MSVIIMGQVWKHAPFDKSKLLVLLALADHADDDGVCWPSIETIAVKARCSVSWVYEALNELERAGWVRRESRTGRSNRYTVSIPDRTPPVSGPLQSTGPHPSSGLDPEPSKEPSLTTAVVANAGTTAASWKPHANAVALARTIAHHLDVDVNIVRYIARCAERGKRPTSTEWLRWLTDDEQEAIAAIEQHRVDGLTGVTDDCGVPLNQRKATPPPPPDGPVIDFARCAVDPEYLATVKRERSNA